VAFDRTANLLGALVLAVGDRMDEATAGAAGHSDSAPAALSALLHILKDPSIDLLRRVLGLTSSGTVRLVDRLEADGYVRRVAGRDGRQTAIVLTPAGRQAARKVARSRADVLEEALAPLRRSEREALDAAVSKILVSLMREPGAVRWTCRLCDTQTCGRYAGACPVGNAARERYG